MVLLERIELSTSPFKSTSAFAAARRAFVGWTVPSPWAEAIRAARPVSTPSLSGLARDCHGGAEGFPDFGQLSSAGFPAARQITKGVLYH